MDKGYRAGTSHWGKVIAKNNSLAVIDCIDCQHAHLYPIPDTSEYYDKDEFYEKHSPKNWLYKETTEYNNGQWNAAYQYQMSLFNTRLPIIDVGCSTGTFLDYWRAHGGRLGIGVEPSNSAKKIAKEMYNVLVVADDAINTIAGNTGMNIRMSLVLEHIDDPLGFLRKYVALMNPEINRLMVIVPNEFNPLQNIISKKNSEKWFVSSVHINYFTPKTLRCLFNNAGLNVVHESATFPMELAEVIGYKYIGNDQKGKSLHNFRLKTENFFGHKIFNLYKLVYEKLGWGREIIMIGEKM